LGQFFGSTRAASILPSRPLNLAAAERSACQGWPRLPRPPEGLRLDWPEHGGTLDRIGPAGARCIIGKFKPVALMQIHPAGNSMNWDTVFEQGIARTQKIDKVEYGCGATPVRFTKGKLKPRKVVGETLTVLKPHGSVNWLYCDACRDIFWVAPEQTEQVAQTLFRAKDWDAVGATGLPLPKTLEPECGTCQRL
jgi:hypothetical protein